MANSILALCALLALSVLVSGQLKRSCDVHGQPSTAVDCDQLTGEAACPADHYGPLCEPSTGGVCPTDPGTTCDPDGTALDGSSDPQCKTTENTCICKDGYSGDRCNEKMITATCGGGEMTVSITNYEPLNGDSFAHNYYISQTNDFSAVDPLCQVEDNTDTTYTTDVLTYGSPPAAPAGCNAVPQAVAGTANNVEIFIFLQHISTLRLKTDQIYRIECNPDGGLVTTEQLSQTTDSDPTQIDSTHAKVDDAIMDLKKETPTNTYEYIDAAVDLGQKLALIIQHPLPFTLKSCEVASNDAFDANPQELIDDSQCAVSPGYILFHNDIAYAAASNGDDEGGLAANHVYRLPISAFVWPDGATSVFFRCHLCFSQPCATETPTCPVETSIDDVLLTQFSSLLESRRRRAAELGGGATLQLSVSVKVENPTEAAGNVTLTNCMAGNSEEVDVGKCYNSISVLLPIILLAVLLLVAMVMTFFFCTRVLRDREMAAGSDNMAYKS